MTKAATTSAKPSNKPAAVAYRVKRLQALVLSANEQLQLIDTAVAPEQHAALDQALIAAYEAIEALEGAAPQPKKRGAKTTEKVTVTSEDALVGIEG